MAVLDFGAADALANYNFIVEADGVNIGEFQGLSGLGAEVDVIENNYVGLTGIGYRKQIGNRKWNDVTLKRGVTDNEELLKWFRDVIQGNNMAARRTVTIQVKDVDISGTNVRKWTLHNAWPKSWKIGDLSAGSNEVLVEEVTLVHEGLQQFLMGEASTA